LQQQNSAAKLINVAGRQRMLSQRISKLTLSIYDSFVQNEVPGYDRFDSLQKLVASFEHIHYYLIKENQSEWKSEAIDSLLNNNTQYLKQITEPCIALVKSRDFQTCKQAMEQVGKADLPFLLKMEKIVSTFQMETEDKLKTLKQHALILGITATVIFIAGFVFIILPVVVQLQFKNQKLMDANSELATSEEEIRSNLDQIHLLQTNLEVRQRQYQSLIDDATDMIYELNEEGKFSFINPVLETKTGFAKEELLGKYYWDLVCQEDVDRIISFYNDQRKKGQEVSYTEFRMETKSGKMIWIGQNVRMFYNKKWVYKISVVARDITKIKDAEVALQESKQKAEKATLAKSQFLGMMSHEIRTPMNGIIGLTNILMAEKPRPDQLENLNLLKFSCDNLLTIINDILDFSKIESGKMELESAPMNISEIIHNCQKLFIEQARSKGLDLKLDLDGQLPAFVSGDPVRLGQILNNLIGNAIKFTERGFVEISMRVLEKQGKEHRIQFAVKDSGIGIPPDKIEFIFEDFSQAATDTTRKFGGTGLGLSIAKKLSNLMGGEIKITSELGVGSEFSFELNLREITPVLSAPVADEESIPRHQGTKLLLVEDNKVNQVVAINFLQRWGVGTAIAENGEEAVEKLESMTFDLVLMDIHMPVMDGYEATKVIRAKFNPYFKKLPIIALTADVSPEIQRKILDAGMTDVMSKPFKPGELKAILEKYIPEFKS